MKFSPENHIAGKAYDLDQENMNALIAEFERLTAANRKLSAENGKLDGKNGKLRAALYEIVRAINDSSVETRWIEIRAWRALEVTG